MKLILSVAAFLYSLSSSLLKNCIGFVFFELQGSKWPIWPCFLDMYQKDLPNLALGNFRETKRIYMPFLVYVYLSSNKRMSMSNFGMVWQLRVVSTAFRNVLTYSWTKSCGNFCFKNLMWPKSAKILLQLTYFYLESQNICLLASNSMLFGTPLLKAQNDWVS